MIMATLIVLVFLLLSLIALAFYFRKQSLDLKEKERVTARSETILKEIIHHTSSKLGQDYLNEMCIVMADLLKVKYLFVGEFSQLSNSVKTITLAVDGVIVDNITYNLEHTPCEVVVNSDICCIESGVKDLYPKDDLLKQMNVDSYIGTPLIDSKKQVIGIFVALHDKKMPDVHIARSIINVFASRVAVELERIKTDRSKQNIDLAYSQSLKLENIGTISTGIAHEFNNILTPIIGNLEILELKVSQNQDLLAYVQKAQSSVERARQLVQNLTKFGQNSKLPKDTIPVQKVLAKFDELAKQYQNSHIKVTSNKFIPEGVIKGNLYQISQVFNEIFKNAIESIGMQKGKIDITTGSENINGKIYLGITVSDTGIGISDDVKGKIFHPFFTTKSHAQATGLGLNVAYTIMKDHGGMIQILPHDGLGAKVRMLLPLQESTDVRIEEKNNIAKQKEIEQQTSFEKILIVDDEEELIGTLVKLLELHGYNSKSFSKAEDALEEFRHNPQSYSMIITDMTMPGMTGEELIRELKKIDPTKPIVLSTGYGYQSQNNKDFDILLKPFELKELLGVIKKNLTPSPKL